MSVGIAIPHPRAPASHHHTDQPKAALKPPLVTSQRDVTLTLAVFEKVDTSKIIPGHGPLSNKAELKAYRDMLAKVYANVDAMVKARKTLAQVIAASRDLGEVHDLVDDLEQVLPALMHQP